MRRSCRSCIWLIFALAFLLGFFVLCSVCLFLCSDGRIDLFIWIRLFTFALS